MENVMLVKQRGGGGLLNWVSPLLPRQGYCLVKYYTLYNSLRLLQPLQHGTSSPILARFLSFI